MHIKQTTHLEAGLFTRTHVNPISYPADVAAAVYFWRARILAHQIQSDCVGGSWICQRTQMWTGRLHHIRSALRLWTLLSEEQVLSNGSDYTTRWRN